MDTDHADASTSTPAMRLVSDLIEYFCPRSACDLSYELIKKRDVEVVGLLIKMKLRNKEFPIEWMLRASFGYYPVTVFFSCKDYEMAEFIIKNSSAQQRSFGYLDLMSCIFGREKEIENLLTALEFLLTLRGKYDIEVDGKDVFDCCLSEEVPEIVVDMLLRNGCANEAHRALNHCIMQHGHRDDNFELLERCKWLINEFDISLSVHGLGALEEAVRNNHLHVVEYLITQNVDVNLSSALRIAVTEDTVNLQTLKHLLARGARTDQIEDCLRSLVKQESKLRLLLKHGVNFGKGLLPSLVKPCLVKLLLQYDLGAVRNPDFINPVFNVCCGNQALHFPLDDEMRLDILTQVIDAGFDFTKFEPLQKKSVLAHAISKRFGKSAKFTSALGKAVAKNDDKKFTELIVTGVGSKRKLNDNPCWNALHVAADFGRTEMARRLVFSGAAELQAITSHGYTAFHLAAAVGHADTLLALVEKP